MFIKVIKRRKDRNVYKYAQIVEGYREKGKVKHKVIAYLGRLTDKEIDSLIKGLNKLKAKPYSLKPLDLKHRRIYSYGDLFLLSNLWKRLKIDKIIEKALKTFKVEFNVATSAFLMIANRCIDPDSKLGVFEWQNRIYLEDMEKMDYHKLLRTLDYLEKIKDEVEEKLFLRHLNLFNQKIDIVFYDITSSYFEGRGPKIAKRGYSSDKRPDRPQILLALAITKDGIPIGHEVYEGNKKHSKTVIDVVDRLKERFGIEKIIFVADRGMVSKENIDYIKGLEYDYIFSLRKRRLLEVKDLMEQDFKGYEVIKEQNKVKLYFKEVLRGNIRYFICHNPQIAEEDLKRLEERQEKKKEEIEKIFKNYKDPGVIIKHIARISDVDRYFRYRIRKGKVEYEGNEESMRYEKVIAGKWVLKTENKEMSGREVIEAYKNLQEIERAFRTIKSFLDIRPMYHKDDKRIKGHVFICVLGYYIQKVIEKMLRISGLEMGGLKMIEKMGEIKMIESEVRRCKILQSIELRKEHKEILSALGIPRLPEMAYMD